MIELSDVAAGYGSSLIFEHLTWRLEPRDVLMITGPSGCGKSTLLYVLGLMITPKHGTLRFDGVDVGLMSDAARSSIRRNSVGFVFQDACLDPTRTVMDNVLEGSVYARGHRSHDVNKAADLLDQFGVEVPATRRPTEVSGGQAQRIALCRALIKDPTVILADEPTGNLDKATAGVVLDGLAEAAARGVAVVIVTHDTSQLHYATRTMEW